MRADESSLLSEMHLQGLGGHAGQARKEVSGKFRSNITLFTGEKNVYWIDVDDSKGPGVGQATFFFMRQ